MTKEQLEKAKRLETKIAKVEENIGSLNIIERYIDAPKGVLLETHDFLLPCYVSVPMEFRTELINQIRATFNAELTSLNEELSKL